MSTPRRPAPRSSGAPIRATRLTAGCAPTATRLTSGALMDQAERAGAPVRVLLADDDPSFIASLLPLIEHQPELTVVGAAANGLDVIDLHMPLVDGVTAVARLRKDHPSICLIALTGDPDAKLHEAVAEAGADAVLEKADLVDTLVDRLAAVRGPAGSG